MASTRIPSEPSDVREETASSPSWPVHSIAAAHAILTAKGARFEMETAIIRGIPTRVWKNAPPTLRDVFLRARSFGDARTCLVLDGERVHYEAFARAVLALAADFRDRGLARGDRVAIAMRNLPEWPVAMFAAALVGAIATPCNAWGKAEELQHALSDSGASFLVIDAERLARIGPSLDALPALKRVYLTRAEHALDAPPSSASIVPLEAVFGAPSAWSRLPEGVLPEIALSPDDDAMIIYTSGTTGKPKGALCTHRNVCSNTLTTACAKARALVRRGESPPVVADPRVVPQQAILLAVPMFHVMGCMPWMVAGLYQGSKIVLMRKWDATEALGLIARERITQAGGVPTMAFQLIDHPALAHYDLSSLEAMSYGGAPAAPELARRVRTLLPRAIPSNGWGMTEVTSSFASNGAEDYVQRPDSCGVPAPVNDWKVVDEEGRSLPAGEVGALWVRGPQVVRGYWNDPEGTAATFVDGWLRTGDVARIDEEGFGYIVDRAKDMLIRGGENIYCVEVENVLFEHPAVMDAAVVGVPHRTLGEEPAAVVQPKPDVPVTEAALQAFVATRLARFKVPVRIVFTPVPLPRNAAGKVMKQALKAQLSDG